MNDYNVAYIRKLPEDSRAPMIIRVVYNEAMDLWYLDLSTSVTEEPVNLMGIHMTKQEAINRANRIVLF